MRPSSASLGLSSARLEVVGELASLINSTYDLHEIFTTAIVKLQKVMAFRRASVLLVSDDRAHYYLHTLFDAARGGFIQHEATFPLDKGLPGQAIQTGRAMRVDSFGGTEGIREKGEVTVSALIVPLRLDGEVIGTLNLGARESATYGDEDLELAVLLARQIETSLHYSKLLYTIERQREALAHQHEQVESERTRLEALIEASDAAILMVSDDKVAHANHAMAELLGLPREIVVGAPMDKINRVLARSLADPEALAAQSAALQTGGAPLRDRVEFEFPLKLTCQRTMATVRDQGGEVLGQLLLYRDVTREAQAEAAKSEFVSVVSHELRTPLTSIKTSLSLLFKGAAGTVDDKTKGLLDIALRNLERLIRLVDDLLDLSRIESGHITTKLVPTSLLEVASRAVDSVRGFAKERAVKLEWDPIDDGTVVMADPDRLEQVIINLMSNAIKFSPSEGRVELRWWAASDFAVLEIRDDGPGIPADQLEIVFEKFRQLERSATRLHGGAGLGLSISRTIVQTFGGELWAESEEGRGSRFFVRLRLAQGGLAPAEDTTRAATDRHSVLVAEKDPDLQRVFQVQFQNEGWEVEVTSLGADALEKAGGWPDLIAVGLELEDMHGLEFLQRLRRAPATVDIPALLVGPGGDVSQAVGYGADGWVVGDADGLLSEAKRLVSARRRPVILLIEDDPAARLGLARGLRRAGYACLEASSGGEGLELAHHRTPDLVVTDWHVPGIDGLSLLRELRNDPVMASVPAIVVTGRASSVGAEELRSLRASLVAKPLTSAVLVKEIERLIPAEPRPR